MKFTLLVFSVCFGIVGVFAQDDQNVVSQTGSLTLTPLYQRWSSDGNELFSETSTGLAWYQPLSREASILVRSSYASASGNITSLSSLNDAQIAGTYFIEPANTVFSLGLNLPTGKSNLTPEEFETSFLISNSSFMLQVPHFGAGLSISPAATWAIPLSEEFVGGLGVMYQYRGPFTPLEEAGKYKPGDEVSFTGGLDARIDPVSTMAVDAVFTLFGKDKLDGKTIFSAGNKLLAALRFKRYFTLDELTVVAVFVTRSNAKVNDGNSLIPARDRIEPNRLDFATHYMMRVSEYLTLRGSAEARLFQETSADFSGSRLFAVGAGLEFTLSDNIAIPVRLKYTFGKTKGEASLQGMELGLGLVVSY